MKSNTVSPIPPLIQLTLIEAKWLHRNRTSEYAHKIIIAKNRVDSSPLEAFARIEWNRLITAFRDEAFHPANAPPPSHS